jgi:inner membrane protein
MDNLSHTLAGLAAAELLHRCLPAEPDPARQRIRHRLLLVACTLASNFPDLDLVLTPLLPEPLGYLLHHRGHTHTLLYALPQAVLLCALLWLLWPAARTLLRQSGQARRGLAGAMVAGFGLHLAMDYLNSYGLHPFHPIDSRWLYGDLVFIIEPTFWVAFGVPLAASVGRPWLRAGLLVLLATVLAYFAAGGFLHWGSLLALYALGAALVAVQLRVRPHGGGATPAIATGFAALGLFILVQATASQLASARIVDALAGMDPASTVLDSARTAFPANPLCWSFVSIEADEAAGRYRLRRGVLALAPGLLPVGACPAVLAERNVQRGVSPDLALVGQHEGSLAELRSLQRDNCHFEAWLRFARAPQLAQGVASDMRYTVAERDNFTTMDLSDFEGRACPRHVPRWAFPRADLLQAQ